jgi:hypothetical protein
MKKLLFILIFSFSIFNFQFSTAQCAMCKRVAETNFKDGNKNNPAIKRGKSLNNGILYLLSVPYLLGAVGVVVWYKNRKKE